MMAQWLPGKMGNECAKVVFRCLRVGEDGFIDAEVDEEEVVLEESLGLSYIRYVLDGLDNIVV